MLRVRLLGPLTVVTSPLQRCRSTAQAYADLVGAPVQIAPEVAEIPSPEGVEMAHRVGWLRGGRTRCIHCQRKRLLRPPDLDVLRDGQIVSRYGTRNLMMCRG